MKFKVFLNWFFRVGTSILLLLFVLFSHFSLLPNLLEVQSQINKKETYEYEGILELWHVETFEGGSQNRGKFLESIARKFEQKHKGTYVVVLSMTLEQFNLNYSAGKIPNILSFGIGVGDEITKNLTTISADNIRNDLLFSGKYKSKQLALPYMLGGYAYISKDDLKNSKKSTTGTGLIGTNNPLCSAKQNNLDLTLYNDSNFDSYNCYDKFLKGNFENLLGTQRDVYRISNRQQKGLLTDYKIYPLGGYSDLIQYVSVFQNQKVETELSIQFAKYLLSDEVQTSISKISMFSVLQNKNLYDSGIYQQMEQILNENLKTENAFVTYENIQSKKENRFEEYKKN